MGTTWIILGSISLILIFVYWRKRGAACGGLTLGMIVGVIITIIRLIKGDGLSWVVFCKVLIVGVIIGVLSEWLGLATDRWRKKH
jgi:uncharacterized membrane protein